MTLRKQLIRLAHANPGKIRKALLPILARSNSVDVDFDVRHKGITWTLTFDGREDRVEVSNNRDRRALWSGDLSDWENQRHDFGNGANGIPKGVLNLLSDQSSDLQASWDAQFDSVYGGTDSY